MLHSLVTLFGLNSDSLIWELFNISFVKALEQESGQILIHKSKSVKPLIDRLALVHGDKDFYRFAWLKSDQSFHMARPPSTAGEFLEGTEYCGRTIVQHDPKGDIVFFHRNKGKMDRNETRRVMWTHIEKFNSDVLTEHFKAHQTHDICFGGNNREHYQIITVKEAGFENFERKALDFAQEFVKKRPDWIQEKK